MRAHLLRQLLEDQRSGHPVVLATALGTGHQALLYGGDGRDGGSEAPFQGISDAVIASTLRVDEARVVQVEEGSIFLRPYNPPPRLIVIGAVHIAQALMEMAERVGFRTVVVDPREGFATEARFPDGTLDRRWPEEALTDMGLDGRTGVVALTHDPKIDDPALLLALRSGAFYVGALGGRKTQGERRRRLGAAGIEAGDLDRIHGPIGLDIGARSPEEIAVAVLAEIIAALRRPPPGAESP